MNLRATRGARFWVGALLFSAAFGCDGEGDDGTPNDGSGGAGATTGDCDDDEVVMNGETYTEAPSDGDPLVCDSQIMAARYDDFVGMGVGYNLLLHWDYDADTGLFGSFVSINIYGDEPGEYEFGPTPAGAADFVWQMGDTPLPCLADSGSVTVDSLGMEGELVTGELDLGISDSGCPASVTATFSMTVVDGGSLVE